jgi:hypothetical protein
MFTQLFGEHVSTQFHPKGVHLSYDINVTWPKFSVALQ